MSQVDRLKSYVERHFIGLPELAARGGTGVGFVSALINAGAIPGPSYRIWPGGAFWSAVGDAVGSEAGGSPTEWYSTATVWWIRRAVAMAGDPAEIAASFRKRFIGEFGEKLALLPDGNLAYPDAYAGSTPTPAGALSTAEAEWADWISGGYGVCLRHWSAADAIEKMLQRGRVIALTEGGTREDLSDDVKAELIDAMERLEAVMLPFAPHQRATGTPGLWIDRILLRYGLGQPAGGPDAADGANLRLCA